MKKSLKITLIAAGAVLTCGALFLAIGGIPFRWKTQEQQFELTDIVAEPFPYSDRGVPEDYVSVRYHEWTLSAPVQLHPLTELRDSGEPQDSDERVYYDTRSEEAKICAVFQKPDDLGDPGLTSDALSNPTLWRRFCVNATEGYSKKLGHSVGDFYSLYNLFYHMTGDAPCTSFRDGIAYSMLTSMKEEMLYGYDTVWELHTETADGFITYQERTEATDTIRHFAAFVDLFLKDARNTECSLILSTEDKETLFYMINSVQFDPEKAKQE